MNISSTSSFLSFSNGTSSGGNLVVNNGIARIVFFENGNILVPNRQTTDAIRESDQIGAVKYNNVDDFMNMLND